jgi:phage N-6-adenine-methyltransferase
VVSPVLYSSATDQWSTPTDLFATLDHEFGFTLDAAADATNARCLNYYTREMDGLKQTWTGVVWCNPPYGRQIGRWVAKASESAATGATVVMLLPARTDTKWWHQHIWNLETSGPRAGVTLRFIKGRLKFGNSKAGAPFPSVICVFRPAQH